jgi:hypothetical protein
VIASSAIAIRLAACQLGCIERLSSHQRATVAAEP